MRIALVHDHYDVEHLAEVIEQMKTLGAPKIHAVWMECYGHYAALEGCHRIRAAKELGLVPEIIETGYSDEIFADYQISEVCDDSYKSTIVEFDE